MFTWTAPCPRLFVPGDMPLCLGRDIFIGAEAGADCMDRPGIVSVQWMLRFLTLLLLMLPLP